MFGLFNLDPEQRYGLMMAAAQMMQPGPGGTQGALGRGLMSGLQGHQAAMGLKDRRAEEAQQRAIRQGQIDDAARARADRARIDSIFAQNTMPGNLVHSDDDGNPMPAAPQGLNLDGLKGGLMSAGPAGISALSGIQGLMAKESPYGKVDIDKFTPESIRAFDAGGAKDRSLLVPRVKMEVSNGLAYDPFNTKPGDFVTGPLADVVPDGKGGWMPNPAKLALKRAGATNVTVTSGQAPFAKEFGEGQAKDFFTLRKSADRAAETITTIHQMRESVDGGMYSGGGAGFKAGVANFLKPMGFAVNEDMLANTAAFNMSAGKFLLQHAKDLGANPSNADAARLDKIIGTADTDPNAMAKLMDWQEDMARRAIKKYNGIYEQIKKNPQVFSAYDMSVAEPPAYQSKPRESIRPAPAGADINALKDHYLKKKR